MRVAVVVSTWTGHPANLLHSLCESMAQHPAGVQYHLFLSANGTEYSVPAEVAPLFTRIFIRENSGYNLGAWDYAWRRLSGYDRFLFLQDECRVVKDNWLRRFNQRFEATPRCGLVGENLKRSWDKPWSDLCDPQLLSSKDEVSVTKAVQARRFRIILDTWGIHEGATARHMTTVVQFTSRSILEEVNGYNLGQTKKEAMAAEIGFSRKVEAKGYALVQIGRHRHSVIAHRQWPPNHLLARLKRSFLKRVVGEPAER